MPDPSSDVSQLLDAWSDGDSEALDQLMPLVSDELRRIARRCFHDEPSGHTLQPTAVVNEAFIRLKAQRKVQWHGRSQFFGVAAGLIRRILVDYARRRRAEKRGGKMLLVPLDEAFALPEEQDPDLVALDDALVDLARLDPRQARIVELRFFGGLDFQEIAELEQISRSTAWREWKTALPFLRRELSRGPASGEPASRGPASRGPDPRS